MKRLFTLSILILCAFFELSAQENHLIIFSEDIQPFYAYVNGIKQNAEAQTNVKVTGLTEQAYKLKVIHEDSTIPTLDKSIYFEPMGSANTLKITQTKKGYKLRFFGQVPLEQSPQNYTEVVYHMEEEPVYVMEVDQNISNSSVKEDVQINTDMNMGGQISMSSDVTIEENVPSGSTETTSEKVTMDVSIGGFNMGVDVNVTETTTESIDLNQTITYTEVEDAVEVVEVEREPVSNYSGPCNSYMGPMDFENAKTSIESKSFADSQMTISKQITKSNCLNAEQIKEIMMIFSFESDRLDYAKFAYEHCFDQSNYYKVNDAFDFEMSIEELDEHISK